MRHWIADSGPGIGSCVVCMYVCHAFGMHLIFGKDRLSSGKDHSGIRNMCHVALKNATQKDWRTWRTYFCARVAARKLSKPERVLEEQFDDVQSFKRRLSLVPLPLSSLVIPRPFHLTFWRTQVRKLQTVASLCLLWRVAYTCSLISLLATRHYLHHVYSLLYY